MRRRLSAMTAGILSAFCVTALTALTACGASGYTVSPGEVRCRTLCEASKACLPPEKARLLDCYTDCDDLEGINLANGCEDEVDAYYDCIERHGVCADIDVECIEQQDVYSDCIADQCSSDPDRDVCF
jgi:hypothetical protein